jgi:hypothetical protein
MSDDRDIIDVEAVEIEDLPNLPAVVHQAWSDEGVDQDTITRKSGKTYTAKPGRTAAGLSLDADAVARHDAVLAANPERRCVGKNADGQQCRKFAIMGSTVCKSHGGATEHIKSAARIRVENAQHKLIGKLIDFAYDDTKPPDVQLRAIRDALDRGGLKPPAEVVLSQGEPKPYEQVFDGIYSGPPIQAPSVSTGYDSAGLGQGVADAETVCAPTQPHPGDQTRSTDQASPREYVDYTDSSGWSEGSESFGDESPRRPRPRESDRDRRPRPPERHITGENAMRAANMANEMNRDMPPPLAIESRHKRYRRP